MDDDCENDTYVQSPFGCLMQISDDKTLDSFDSLSNLIKTHSSKPNFFSNKHETIDENESNRNTKLDVRSGCKSSEANQFLSLFNNDSEACHNYSHNTSFDDLSISDAILISEHTKEADDSEEFGTLEEYAKSFLQTKGNPAVPSSQFRTTNYSTDTHNQIFFDVNPDLANVNETLSKVHISDQKSKSRTKSVFPDTNCNSDYWNIDLSVALQDSKMKKLKLATSSELNMSNYEPSNYLAHVKECDLDISRLADQKLMYSNATSSSFGFVLSRKWKALPLAKRFRTIGICWPYNASKSFKFDSPSPDDINLRNKRKTRTTSLNEI